MHPNKRRARPSHLARLALMAMLGVCFAAFTTPATARVLEPSISAEAYILMDAASGQVLLAKDAEKPTEMASLSKMMVAYLVMKNLKAGVLLPDERVRVDEDAFRKEGSKMFLGLGTFVPVDTLLRGIIIQSGNDAAIAIAKHIAGSEAVFASLMNAEATRLGMTNTIFKNATGLTAPEHYSTARDLALLAGALIRDFPEYYPLFAEKEMTYAGIRQLNRNRLLWRDPKVDGLKTGHTDSAGFCLAASAKVGNMRLIAILLGAQNDRVRFVETQKLLNFGFHFYETRKLADALTPIQRAPIWFGRADTLAIGSETDTYVSLEKAIPTDMTYEIGELAAPIKAGEKVGNITVTQEGAVVATIPLIALETVERTHILGRLYDSVRRLIGKVIAFLQNI